MPPKRKQKQHKKSNQQPPPSTNIKQKNPIHTIPLFHEFLHLLNGDAAALGVIYHFVSDTLAWSLTCSQFYHVAQAQKFGQDEGAAVTFVGMKNFQLARVLQLPFYEKKLNNVTFYRSAGFVIPVLNKFMAKLQRLQLCHLPEDFQLPKAIVLPKLTFIKFFINVTYNPAKMVQQWLARMPNLQTVAFDCRIPKSYDNTWVSQEAQDWLLQLPELVTHVPHVEFVVDTQIKGLPQFGSNLGVLDFVVKKNLNHKILQSFTNLLDLRVTFVDPVKLKSPLIFNLPKLQKLTINGFELPDAQSEAFIFKSIPVTVEKLDILFCHFLAFPDIQHLVNLSMLHISYAVIEKPIVPTWLSSLIHLVDVQLTFKDYDDKQKEVTVNTLPKSIKTLSTSMCRISEQVVALHNLSSVDLVKSRILQFQELPKLQTFSMTNCKDMLVDASFPFHMMKMVSSLLISDQTVKNLSGIASLQRLSSLNLYKCEIEEIPIECAMLPYLKSLDIRDNKIIAIDTKLLDENEGFFPSLSELHIAGNPLKALPARVNLSKLQSLAMSPLVQKMSNASIVPPANIKRQEWTAFVMQHFKNSQENSYGTFEGTKQITEVYLDYAIPCKNDMIIVSCHLQIWERAYTFYDMQLQRDDESDVVILFIHVPTKKVHHSYRCWFLTSLLKRDDRYAH